MASPENRLGHETSPYLRQHRFDPVDWYPWGPEALARAAELDRPLFLSIGYSACHWCHVMAHESFSDEATASEMNEIVVAVKVDREERPDVDSVYMESVLAANGSGGWPMSVFVTPDGRPFFAGTYFPDRPRQGMPSFRQVLAAISDVWANRREDVESQATALAEVVARRMAPPKPLVELEGETEGAPGRHEVREAVSQACTRLGEIADPEHGGFGDAPKFPQPLLLDLLLRAHVAGIAPIEGPAPLRVVLDTLEAMGSGGIYDQIGGGFARYSVDRYWLAPHFEKMLYDQALLSRVLLHAWQLTRDDRWRQLLDETLPYVLSRLAHPSGALCSAEDADSEGEEGRYYLWSKDEVIEVVGEELAEDVCAWYGVSEEGNFDGRNILTRPKRGELARPHGIERARQLLSARRQERVPPGLDDKVITEWNAMTCSVLAEAAGATGDARYRQAAEQVAGLLLGARAKNGSVTPRSVRFDDGAQTPGFAGDVAWLLEALTRLFELTGEISYLDSAREVAGELIDQFVDLPAGTVFTTRADAEPLVVRPAELHDGVIPAACSVAALGLSRLAALLGEDELASVAQAIVAGRRTELTKAPTTLPEMLWAAEIVTGGFVEIAAVGKARGLLPLLRRSFVPTALYVWLADGSDEGDGGLPLLEGREEEAVYICRNGTCRLPAASADEVAAELEQVLSAYAKDAPR